jgi:hypothetical protein
VQRGFTATTTATTTTARSVVFKWFNGTDI